MKKTNCIFKLFIFTFIFTVILTGCGKSASPNSSGTNTSSGNSGSETNSQSGDLEKNITSSGATTAKGTLVVFAKNNNKIALNMEIEVEFYDKDNKIVGSDSKSIESVGANAEIAVEMYNTPNSFDNYKIFVDIEETKNTTYFDKVELTHNNNGKEIVVQVKNNSKETIEYMSVAVVFYQGDKVVGFDDGSESDTKSGRAANFNLYYPYNKRYDNVKFDNYKVFINEAYTYNW